MSLYEVGDFELTTGTGTQTVTLTDVVGTPDLVLLIGSYSTNSPSTQDNSILSVGAMTSSGQCAHYMNDADARNLPGDQSEPNRYVNNASVIHHNAIGASKTVQVKAVYSSMGAGEFTINKTTNSLGSNHSFSYLVLTDVEVEIVTQAMRTTTGTETVSHSLSGTPDLVIWMTGGATSLDTVSDHAIFGMGFTDGTNSYSLSCWSENGSLSTSDVGSKSSSTFIDTTWNGADRDVGSLTSLDENDLQINMTSVGGGTQYYSYIFIKGVTAEVANDLQTPTSTGSEAFALGSGSNKVIMKLMSNYLSTDSGLKNGFSFSVGLLSNAGTNNSQVIGASCEDNADPTNNNRSWSRGATQVLDETDGSDLVASSFTEMTDTGWTEDFTTVNATATVFGALSLLYPATPTFEIDSMSVVVFQPTFKATGY